MTITNDIVAKLLAYQLTQRFFADSPQKLTSVLQDAKVDLNPHQIEAALFAFKSPFSKGAILADEVGLGKTIEAGILISQHFAEQKKKIMIIAPASLRKQWNGELYDKFYLQSTILEKKSFDEYIKQGIFNPFEQPQIVITSYNFAKSKLPYIKAIDWDLIIIDEAHRLRNAYRSDNVMAKALKESLMPYKKILLTATPLQNSLLELYSLVSFIDEKTFGDLESFKQNYLYGEKTEKDTEELKRRISPIIYRTLRRQVRAYVKYTKRIPLTQEFEPNENEQRLYNLISAYLQRDKLIALPNSQRQLITLIMRKLLDSSTFAISGTLQTLIARLNRYHDVLAKKAAAEYPPEELADEDFSMLYVDEDEEDDDERQAVTAELAAYAALDEEQAKIKDEQVLGEIAELESFLELAKSISENSKGRSLLTAIRDGFAKLDNIGANKKAVIFTESRRTQEYVQALLESQGYDIVLFNGSNSDPKSKKIYEEWLRASSGTGKISGSKTADKRAALVEYFRDTADIMIATEAAAEGINLQFCSLVVNYDLPWNPQRIEQRIGRCHRYGQRNDVVVINFLNTKNLAAQRVFELLRDKFMLFEGVFGSSDEILGSIESGIDFEKRISKIYSSCRTEQEINLAFDTLKAELNEQIVSQMAQTRKDLLENFDEAVHEKLRVNLQNSREYIDAFTSTLWDLTSYVLRKQGSFDQNKLVFEVHDLQNLNGVYAIKPATEGISYRAEHPLAKHVIATAKAASDDNCKLTFDITNNPVKSALLLPLIGSSGQLAVYSLEVSGISEESRLLYVGFDDKGQSLSPETIERLFRVQSELAQAEFALDSRLEEMAKSEQEAILAQIESRNSNYFDDEMDKLERWSNDLKLSLEQSLRKMDIDIKTMKTEARKCSVLATKLKMQREIKELEAKRNKLRLSLFEELDAIDDQKEALISDIAKRLKQNIRLVRVLAIEWSAK